MGSGEQNFNVEFASISLVNFCGTEKGVFVSGVNGCAFPPVQSTMYPKQFTPSKTSQEPIWNLRKRTRSLEIGM